MLDIALAQLCLWMETPKPRVMKPTMGSPGRGEQHFANLMGGVVEASTTTPSVAWTRLKSTFGRSSTDLFSAASAALSFCHSSLSLGRQLAMVMPP
mgnify:CR=1 FL=1